MPTPALAAAGTGAASTTTTVNVGYPSGITAGDVLVIQAVSWNNYIFTMPAGWTLITSSQVAGLGSHYAFYKIADGTESGTVTVTRATGHSSGMFARMYRFTGAGGAVFEGAATGSGDSTTVPDTGVTTTGLSRLAVNLVEIHDWVLVGAFAGMTGGTWAEAISEWLTGTGNNAVLQIQTATMLTAATINGGTQTVATAVAPGTNEYSVLGFALLPGGTPIGIATETDTAFSITPVLTVPGISVAMGQASETDTALSITASVTAAADLELYVAIDFGAGFEQLDVNNILAADIRRGRPFNLDRVEAGTASARVFDRTGALDPSNTAGPWYGRIHPLTPLRILRREGGITYERFNGPIERFLPNWELPTSQQMEVQAADSFEALANTLIVSDRASLTTNLAGANNDLVFTAVEAGGQGEDITVTYIVAGTNTPLAGETNEPLDGNAIAQASRRPDYRASLLPARTRIPDSVTIQGSDITVNVATDGAGAAISTAAQIKTALEAAPEIAALVTIAHAPGSSGAGVVTAMAKTNLFGGKWPEEMSGTRINRVLDLAGWDAALRDVDPGNYLIVADGFSIKENVSALAHLQDVADSELGYVFMRGNNTFVYHDASHRNVDPRSTASRATFSNVGSGFDFEAIQLSLDKDRIINDATVTAGTPGAVPQTAEDIYSQTGTGTPPTGAPTVPATGYGKRAVSRNTLLANDTDCLAQAEAIVAAFAYPLPRLETLSTTEPDDSDAWVASVLDLEIGDLITVIIRPPAAEELPTTSYEMFVEEITDTYAEGVPLVVGLRLTAAAQSVAAPPPPGIGAILNNLGGPLIIGDATNGKIG